MLLQLAANAVPPNLSEEKTFKTKHSFSVELHARMNEVTQWQSEGYFNALIKHV